MSTLAPALALHPYQQAWFLDRSRFKIGMFARQTGKTFTTCLEIVDDCFMAAAEKRRSPWVILSRGERQAKEAVDEGVKPHARAYKLSIDSWEDEFRVDRTNAIGEQIQVTYKSHEVDIEGSRITAVPANPDTARGYSRNAFLDEFAFHANSRAIWTALFPVISRGWRLRVTSTGNGRGNKFYELVTGPGIDRILPVPAHLAGLLKRHTTDAIVPWQRYIVDIHRAVADGLDRDIPLLRAAFADEDAWRQEFELHFLDETSAWLTYDLITNVEHSLAGDPTKYSGGPVYLGVDVAARNDLFVIWVWELVGDVLWCRELIERRRIPFSEQDALLDDCFRRYRVLRCCMDQTGMGEKPVEDAQKRHGSTRVEGVLFTGPNKLKLATLGKEAFEDLRVRIPTGRPDLRADLHKVKKVVGPTGTPRFVADSDEAGHADRTWAAFLGISAADRGFVPFEFHGSGQQRIGAGGSLNDYIGA